MNAIKEITPTWKVEVTFPNNDTALEFKQRLQKVKETGGGNLYNALLASSLKNATDINIVKERSEA